MLGSDKETNLAQAREAFESSISYPVLEANITFRRRKRGTKFLAEDLLFVIEFKESAQGGRLPIMSCLITMYKVVLSLVTKLRD